MSKKWLLVGLLLVPCLLAACGIPQEDYDAVAADLDAAQQEMETLENDLASTQAQLDETQDVLDATLLLLAKKTEEYSSLESELQYTQDNLAISYEYSDNLSEELKFIRNPKHFESTDEFLDWLEGHAFHILYKDVEVDHIEMSFKLQAIALRDGYLFPSIIYYEDGEIKVANQTYIGSEVYYWVFYYGNLMADIESWQRDLDPIPVYPLSSH